MQQTFLYRTKKKKILLTIFFFFTQNRSILSMHSHLICATYRFRDFSVVPEDAFPLSLLYVTFLKIKVATPFTFIFFYPNLTLEITGERCVQFSLLHSRTLQLQEAFSSTPSIYHQYYSGNRV